MEIKNYIDSNIELIKNDLKDYVAFNSELSDDAAPFGQANRDVLDCALNKMEKYGLKTKNLDYYCGFGEVGNGPKTIGIISHLDIVPAGEGWSTNPFEMVEKDGVLYGRGVSDDKGAGVAALWAVKYLMEEGYEFKNKVRLINGCNEETGSKCLKHYVEKEGHIDLGFTPDGNFPGIYGEKGMVGAAVTTLNSKFIDIHGGTVSNAVCSKVYATVANDSFDEETFKKYLDDAKIKYELTKNENTDIIVYGVAAHASTPEFGKNAISYLLEGLYLANFNDTLTDYYHNMIAHNLHGELIGIDFVDEFSNLSFNVGVISKEEDGIKFTIDIRFPVTLKHEQITEVMEKKMNDENHILNIKSSVNPLFFDPNTPMIKALLKSYQNVTGDLDSKMEVIGGGTYSKGINNCIAFGCEFQGEENHIHDVDERLPIDSLKKQIEIYVEAIKNLDNI